MTEIPAEEQLRRNILELMRWRKMNQVRLAKLLGQSQSWLSRRLSEKPDKGTRFQFSDLDTLSAIFGVSPAQLLQPGYGNWDRRTGGDRRSGVDRRQSRHIVPSDQYRRAGDTRPNGDGDNNHPNEH